MRSLLVLCLPTCTLMPVTGLSSRSTTRNIPIGRLEVLRGDHPRLGSAALRLAWGFDQTETEDGKGTSKDGPGRFVPTSYHHVEGAGCHAALFK